MFSNLKRAVSLTLLASAASVTFAAPAPVSDISSDNIARPDTPASTSGSVISKPETDVERLERLLRTRATVQLQLQQQIDDLTAEVGELRGLVERNSYEMKQMLDRQRQLFIELDKLRSEAKASVETAATAESQPTETGGTFSTDVAEETAYKSAVDLILKKKDYAAAIAAFKAFQKEYPESSYTPNAHYWLGQLYFAQKQDVEAVKSFAAVVAYKDSNKRADSLVKLAEIAMRNDKPDAAKKYYQQVVAEHPNSASAAAAKKQLQ